MDEQLVFVTGGTGFLGHYLVPQLLAEGFRVRMLVRPTSDVSWLDGHDVTFAQGDVTDPASVQKGMAGCGRVVHAAGRFRFWGQEADFHSINVEGTRHVAEAAARAGARRFVHISTIALIGSPPPGETITEQTRCRPADAYQRTKLAAEKEVQRFAQQGLPVVILRPGSFYGPGGRYGFNRLFVEDPMRGLRVQVEGGRRVIFISFVPDVAWAVCRTLAHPAASGTYNICDRSPTHAEVNDCVSELLGISRWRFPTPSHGMIALAALMEWWAKVSRREPFFPLNLRHYVFNDWPVSSERARRELGFEPTPLAEGLRQTVAWYQKGTVQRR